MKKLLAVVNIYEDRAELELTFESGDGTNRLGLTDIFGPSDIENWFHSFAKRTAAHWPYISGLPAIQEAPADVQVKPDTTDQPDQPKPPVIENNPDQPDQPAGKTAK